MRSELQQQASRINGAKSSGPADRSRVRFNGLKHGLRSEHVDVTLPGESREEFDADRRAWFDDWRPLTHTRAVLVERAVIANWKLKRAGRFERARAYDLAADADHEFNLTVKGVVEGGQNLLPRFPAEGLSRLRSHSAGLDCLIGLWDALAGAAESGWTSRTDHHDRLLNLLGHVAGKEPADLGAARASLVLLRAHGAIAEGPAPGASEVAAARALLHTLCAGRAEEFRRERLAVPGPGGAPAAPDRRGDRADVEGGAAAPPLRARAREGAIRGDPRPAGFGEVRRRPPRRARARAPGAARGGHGRRAGQARKM